MTPALIFKYVAAVALGWYLVPFVLLIALLTLGAVIVGLMFLGAWVIDKWDRR